MNMRTNYGLVWVSDDPPYFRDWQGRQFYKFHIADPRRRQRSTLPPATDAADANRDQRVS